MKLLLLSDIHSNTKNLEEILKKTEFDLLLISGDLTHFKKQDVVTIDEIVSKYAPECYAVHGNCDHPEILSYELSAINFIHGKSLNLDDFTIHGIGGSLKTPFGTPSEYTEKDYEEIIKGFKFSDFNILVSHSPAKGILDKTNYGENIGSEAIRKYIERFQISITGHVHESFGVIKEERLAINPGPVNWGRFAILDLRSMEVELRKI
ncbi:MAG: metallophosphoesterase family protein [Archaeoglobaceae archaeon]|nr:metallophosphoesterase family protein [Archaeoglobaceae archaeon]MDW8128759.1 metallophosphoesterase family protein [Archaeoglobaceae archaeon]